MNWEPNMVDCYNCQSTKTTLVHQQDRVITYQNVLMPSFAEAIDIPHGKMALYFCHDCTFLFNAAFDDSLVGYGETYENAQNHSAVFEKHINRLTHLLLNEKEINHHRILEIGCGNGYFLKKLISPSYKNIGCGYDKSLGKDYHEENFRLVAKYYDDTEEGDFDVIISRHVVEHILENGPLVSLLKQKNPHAQFFIETPSLEWIIKQKAFYDIFYEHCSYFSHQSLHTLFTKNGIAVTDIKEVFEGQYLWLESLPNTEISAMKNQPLTLSEVKGFFDEMHVEQRFYQEMIAQEFKNKKIAIWGAGAKGVTFANFIDPHRESIKYIIDINPKKCGKFLPGSGHPIVSPVELSSDDIDVIIIMNPNYQNEIMRLASDKKYYFVTVGK